MRRASSLTLLGFHMKVCPVCTQGRSERLTLSEYCDRILFPRLYPLLIKKISHRNILLSCSWERNYDPVYVRDWMVANPWCPILSVTLYGVLIALGKAYFNGRPAWNWRKSMAFWNLGLSVFSAIGFVRTAPQLIHNLINYGMTENLCFDAESHFGSGATGFWVQVFCLSKIPYVILRYLVFALSFLLILLIFLNSQRTD